jgi:hypothetical protein
VHLQRVQSTVERPHVIGRSTANDQRPEPPIPPLTPPLLPLEPLPLAPLPAAGGQFNADDELLSALPVVLPGMHSELSVPDDPLLPPVPMEPLPPAPIEPPAPPWGLLIVPPWEPPLSEPPPEVPPVLPPPDELDCAIAAPPRATASAAARASRPQLARRSVVVMVRTPRCC